jgi:hypothetical protein
VASSSSSAPAVNGLETETPVSAVGCDPSGGLSAPSSSTAPSGFRKPPSNPLCLLGDLESERPVLAVGMDLCDGLLAPSFSNALKIADPPRKPLSSPPSLPEAPVMLGMESEKQFLSVEGCSGMEAGLVSAVLVPEVGGSASEMARAPELSYAAEAAVGTELALVQEQLVTAEVAGLTVEASGVGLTPVLAPLNALKQPLVPINPGVMMPSPNVASRISGGSELDVLVEQPSPLLCCPAYKARGKNGDQHSDWILQLVMVFSRIMGLSCDGFEGRLLDLYKDIIASNGGKTSGSSSRASKKGTRELNNLFSSINYDARSGGSSRGRNKVRAHREFL